MTVNKTASELIENLRSKYGWAVASFDAGGLSLIKASGTACLCESIYVRDTLTDLCRLLLAIGPEIDRLRRIETAASELVENPCSKEWYTRELRLALAPDTVST